MYKTRYYASMIVEQFETLLEKKRNRNDIRIYSIYGSEYRDLVDGVDKVIVQMLIDNGVPRRDILDGGSDLNKNGLLKEEKPYAGY